MQNSAETNDEHEQQLDAIIAGYYRSIEAGDRIDQKEFISKHPELEKDLNEFFADLGMFQHSGRSGSEDPALDPTNIDTAPQRQNLATGAVVRYFGAHEILEELGSGGMGVVYKARHVRLRKLVALKMIRAGEFASDVEVKMFQAEARAAAKLDHPGIVAVHEVGMHACQHFYFACCVAATPTQGRCRPEYGVRTRCLAHQSAVHRRGVGGAVKRSPVSRLRRPPALRKHRVFMNQYPSRRWLTGHSNA